MTSPDHKISMCDGVHIDTYQGMTMINRGRSFYDSNWLI